MITMDAMGYGVYAMILTIIYLILAHVCLCITRGIRRKWIRLVIAIMCPISMPLLGCLFAIAGIVDEIREELRK